MKEQEAGARTVDVCPYHRITLSEFAMKMAMEKRAASGRIENPRLSRKLGEVAGQVTSCEITTEDQHKKLLDHDGEELKRKHFEEENLQF